MSEGRREVEWLVTELITGKEQNGAFFAEPSLYVNGLCDSGDHG
jgi:hypothetical protein